MLSWGSVEEEMPQVGEIDDVDVDENDFEEEPKVSKKKPKVIAEKSVRIPIDWKDLLPDRSIVKVPRTPTERTPKVPIVPQTPTKNPKFTPQPTPTVTVPEPFVKKVEVPSWGDDNENFNKIPQKSIKGWKNDVV